MYYGSLRVEPSGRFSRMIATAGIVMLVHTRKERHTAYGTLPPACAESGESSGLHFVSVLITERSGPTHFVHVHVCSYIRFLLLLSGRIVAHVESFNRA